MKKHLLTICASLLIVVLCGFLFVGCNHENYDSQEQEEYNPQKQEATIYGGKQTIAKDIFIMCDDYLYFGNLYRHSAWVASDNPYFESYGIELPNGQYILTDKRIMTFTKKPDKAVYSYIDLTGVK